MKRWSPQSLVGQMAVLIGVALLLAQLAAFAFILVERQQFNRAEIDSPAITRFTSAAADFMQAPPEFKSLVLSDASRRGARYNLAAAPNIGAPHERRSDTEARLRSSLATAGVRVTEVLAALDASPPPRTSEQRRRRGETMLLSARLPDKSWINARLIVPAPPPLLTPELWVGTLLVYLFVLSAAVFAALRLARPLGDLTRAADAFRGGNQPQPVMASGPSDLRNAILAFNAMNERVARLLEEKDRTLGAIGHDLRTPLASLRIRAESVEPAETREPIIAKIEEMAANLDDILTLARSGRSSEHVERTDVSKLVRVIGDEYRELGKPVEVAAPVPQFVKAQPNLLKRAVRNLIDNAIAYGVQASIEVREEGNHIHLSVLDSGPGLPPDQIELAAGAFYRAEPSRSRETGGAGLGLAITKAIAEAHGGTLSLANRDGPGLAATIILPTAN
jgi:signal transduction histidine kinase